MEDRTLLDLKSNTGFSNVEVDSRYSKTVQIPLFNLPFFPPILPSCANNLFIVNKCKNNIPEI